MLNIHVVRSLSARSAVTALRGGIDELKKLGIEEPVVVMSDGGSDFTAHEFGAACDEVGTWVRAKVSQKGGMGILERVNRTLKYEF
ncbi:integrase, partial [Deinococcus taklimakanensis]